MSATSHALRERRGSLSTKVLTFVLTVALALSLLPVVPAVAADAGEAQENTVTLTIVGGVNTDWDTGTSTPVTWVNKKYAFEEGDTVIDLLDAAVEAGDIKSYTAPESTYGGRYIGTITSKDGESLAPANADDNSVSLYWSSYFNGEYGQGDCALDRVKLVDGNTYQFGWTCYTTVPTSYDWDAYYAGNEPTGEGTEPTGEGTATLTIATGPEDTWVNKKYVFNDGDTVEDLLDYAVEAGDIKSYTAPDSTYGGKYIGTITSKDGESPQAWSTADYSASTYWSSYFNGEYGQGDCALDHVKLVDGNTYQFGWTCYTTVPTSYDWDAYYADNEPGAATNEPAEPETPGSTTDRPSSDNVATGIDENELGELMDNIAKSYAGTTDPWKVLALSALGMQDTADLPQFAKQAVSDIKNPPQDGNQATAVQRYITALSAAGYDATALPDGDGTYNAVEKMAQSASSSSPVNILISTLWAYASGDYEVPDGAALSEQALVNKILDAQHADGGFAWSGSGTDADMTAMAISALVPYEGTYPGVTDAVNRALSCLQGVQQEDGGFANSSGDQSCNTTASVVIALCAAGLNPATQWATANGSTPLSALLSYAASDLSGFVAYAGDTSVNDMATEQGFMALVAYEGLLNSSDGSYNLYAQAREHTSSIPDYTPNPKEEQEEELVDDATDEGSGDATQTGDSGVGAMALAAAIAMLATFVAGSIAHRRRSSMERGE